MFKESLALPGGTSVAASMLSKIKRSKYPALTEDEERLSIPLQTLAQAIFDGVLVHIVNAGAPPHSRERSPDVHADALHDSFL